MSDNRIAVWAVRYRVPVIVVYLGVAILFATQVPRAHLDPDIKHLIPPEFGSRVRYEHITELFGSTEFLMIGLEGPVLDAITLQRIDALSSAFEALPEIERVMSLTTINDIRAADGVMSVEPLVDRFPSTAAESELLRHRIMDNHIAYGALVGEDFNAAAIVAFVVAGVEDQQIVLQARETIAALPGNERVYVGGLPLVRYEGSLAMRSDLARLLPLGIALMVFFLYASFRRARAVILPFVVVVCSIPVAMGSIALLGWKIQLVTVILPVILIAVANDYGIHLVARYERVVRGRADLDSKQAAVEMVGRLGTPIAAAGITTVAGLLSLGGHVIEAARQLGVLGAIGILYALIGSLFFLPALVSVLPVPRTVPRNRDAAARGGGESRRTATLIETALDRIGTIATTRPRTVFWGTLAVAVLAAGGILRLEIDTDPVSFFLPSSEVARADRFLERHFGGTTALSMVVTGDMLEPGAMRAIDRTARALESRDNIGSVTAVSDVVRRMNRAMHDDDLAFDQIPDSREAIAQYFLLYSFGGDPEDFEKLVDFDYRNALITSRIRTVSTPVIAAEKAAMERLAADFAAGEHAEVTMIGGFADILLEVGNALVYGQLRSLLFGVLIIGALVALLFRSARAGLITMVPIALSIAVLFGLMGYASIPLSTITAMLTSIMIGAGVDYAIHLYHAYRDAYAVRGDAAWAARTALTESGRAITFNALSVMVGFAALLVSGFLPVRFFGFLVAVSIGVCLYTALFFLPAAFQIMGRKR